MATAKPTPAVVATFGPLEIVTFVNRSGRSTSYRVRGTVHRKRIRRNFPTEAAARIFAVKETKGLVTGATRRLAETTLTEQQLRDAEAFAHDLPARATPQQVLKFYLDHHRPIKAVPLVSGTVTRDGKPEPQTGAIDEWANACLTQRKNYQSTVDGRTYRLNSFVRETGVVLSTDITEKAASSWIYSKGSDHTQRDYYDDLNRFVKFLVKRKYILANPLADLPRPIVRLKTPAVLTFNQAWSLLQCALTDAEGPDMLPFFAICVLSGVRPQEVTELGLRDDRTKSDGWEHIHLDDDHPFIEVNKAKGGQSRRNADICEPLRRILEWCQKKGLAANYFSKRKFDRLRERAGVRDAWENDILRHCYASYYNALHKGDTKTLSANMGNSERVLFEHYIRAVPRIEAVMFFGLALHWNAPRERSLSGQRLDKWLAKPLSELPIEKLRILHTRIAGDLARLCRTGAAERDRTDVRTNYEAIRAELRRRDPKAFEEPEKARKKTKDWPQGIFDSWEQEKKSANLFD